jgi:hypothetical protein
MQRLLIIAALTTLISGCVSNGRGRVSIQSGDHPLKLLQYVATESLPTGKREVTDNGRGFHSNYFIPRKGSPKLWLTSNPKAKERYFASIYINGNERPYKISFLVIKEAIIIKNGVPYYKEVATSDEAARWIAKYYQENLEKSLKERNVVDDFRVF